MIIGITGATGFIGNRVLEMGLERGFEMAVFVRTPSKIGKLATKLTVFEGDITHETASKDFVAYCDVIIHAAALVTDWGPKSEFQSVTIDGTKYLLAYLKNTNKKIVHVSSISVYAENLAKGKCTEDLPLTPPLGNYSWAKQEQEKLIIAAAQNQTFTYTIVRASNIFGPNSPSWVIEYIAALKKGPILIGNGEQKGLTYIDNVCDLLLKAATTKAADNQLYNGTDDQEITWKEYANQITNALNLPKPKALPLGIAKIVASIIPFFYKIVGSKSRPPLTSEALNFVAFDLDIPYTKAQKELHYLPIVNKKESLEKTLKYIISSQ